MLFKKNFGEFFKFLCKLFYKLKQFSKVFDDYICAECPPEPKFWRGLTVQDLSKINV